MRRGPRRGRDLLFYQTQISEQWVTKHVQLRVISGEARHVFFFFTLQLNWSSSQLLIGHLLYHSDTEGHLGGGGNQRSCWTRRRTASEQPDRSSFCSAARTYPPDQIFSRHVGKPSICIPAILWGLQKQEFHGDHMRTVKEDFLKANAASLEVGEREEKKKSQLTIARIYFERKDTAAINKCIQLNVQNSLAPRDVVFSRRLHLSMAARFLRRGRLKVELLSCLTTKRLVPSGSKRSWEIAARKKSLKRSVRPSECWQDKV